MSILRVETTYGTVVGKSALDGACTDFLGIPFAKPPVGELRFAAPQEPEPWDGERICTDFAPSAIQLPHHGMDVLPYEVSEDCLYLNVYTPTQGPEEKLPVLFWIYGGGFSSGSPADPEMLGENLTKRGVVVVTVTYRIGVMGFFALPELEEKNGRVVNAGILDQIMALKWVQGNIRAFGGDPERVMVFGQSAGGMSTRMLLTSPLTAGLFSRVAVHSGGGLNEADPIRPKQEFMEICRKACAHLGWTYEDVMKRDALEVSEKLMQAAREVVREDEIGYFQPFRDEYSITEIPGRLIAQGAYPDIPVMCGTVAGDAWMFCRKAAGWLLEQPEKTEYFRGFSYVASQTWAACQVRNRRTPIYTYYMDRKQPPKPREFRRGAPPFGGDTPHTADIAYVFGNLDAREADFAPLDYEMSEAMMAYWTNFAKYGTPNAPEDAPDGQNGAVAGLEKWPAYTAKQPLSMHFGQDGWQAENIVQSETEEKVIRYTMEHPGLLTSPEGLG